MCGPLALVLEAAVVGLGTAVAEVGDDGLDGGRLLLHQLVLLLQLPNPGHLWPKHRAGQAKVRQGQPRSTNVNQGQARSAKVKQGQPRSTKVKQIQPRLAKVNQG